MRERGGVGGRLHHSTVNTDASLDFFEGVGARLVMRRRERLGG